MASGLISIKLQSKLFWQFLIKTVLTLDWIELTGSKVEENVDDKTEKINDRKCSESHQRFQSFCSIDLGGKLERKRIVGQSLKNDFITLFICFEPFSIVLFDKSTDCYM